jgi:iron complex transport system permease protein
VLLAFLVGAFLSVAGTLLQALLLNPLTDPYVTGVSSGAGLGAAIGIVAGVPAMPWVSVLALAGGGTTLATVYSLGRRKGRLNIYVLLLAGVCISNLFAAAISMIMIAWNEDMHGVVYWLLGSFSGRSWPTVRIALLATPFLLVPFFFTRELNIMLLGEERALELGVEVERVKKIMFAVAAVLTAVAVSVSGIIGFVGLVVPHLCRLLAGPAHRRVVPLSLCLGACLMGLSDLISRVVLAPSEIPVGIVTTFLGAPLFIHLLRRRRA